MLKTDLFLNGRNDFIDHGMIQCELAGAAFPLRRVIERRRGQEEADRAGSAPHGTHHGAQFGDVRATATFAVEVPKAANVFSPSEIPYERKCSSVC